MASKTSITSEQAVEQLPVIVLADDEWEFRKSAIRWISEAYNVSKAEREAAISAVGADDSEQDFHIIRTAELEFLIVANLEALWSTIASEFRDRRRLVVFLDLRWEGEGESLFAIREMRQNKDMQHYPVIVYSKSDSESDIKNSYDHTANAYLTKSGSSDERKKKFLKTVKQWTTVTTPPFVSYENN
ncbi:MAG: hypothetical protein AAGD43_01830 [Pseudomonadota bacterium]